VAAEVDARSGSRQWRAARGEADDRRLRGSGRRKNTVVLGFKLLGWGIIGLYSSFAF
jgi:hypothetical protein